jgi:hydrogenase-4 component H
MKLPCLLQWRILKQALTALFSRAYTTAFPLAEPAYEPVRQFRGRPRFDQDECIGCGACAEVCPAKCIDVNDDTGAAPPVRRLVQHLELCIWCGQCERYCTSEKGIRQTAEYEAVGFAPADFEEICEKELLLCECCGEVLAPVDQLRWLVRRLGPLAYANPTLMLVSQKELAVVDEGVRPAEPEHAGRGGRVSLECPHCRRKTALAV